MSPAVMVAVESVCFAFLLVILFAYLILPHTKKLRSDGFFFCLLLTIVAIFFDLDAWICELFPAPQIMQYAGNFLSLIMTSMMVPAFGYYIVDLINDRQPLSRTLANVATAVNGAGILTTIIAGFCDKLFDIHTAEWDPTILIYDSGGFFYDLPIVLCTLSLVFYFILVLRYAKALGRRKLAIVAIYFALPVLASIGEVLFDNVMLSYVASSLSLAIVYTMLQSSRMDEMRLREKVLNEVSYNDQLTGLLNRRACDRDLQSIRHDDSISVVFCDLNGLKRINDRDGHHAGDQFLISFSQMLCRYFDRGSIYRMSGDEFLVVAKNISKEEFEETVTRLREEIDSNAGIAALGTITGTGGSIFSLVSQAESFMYNNKKEYYRKYPEYKR